MASLKDYGKLVITQGEEESLKIEAKGDVLAKIKTEVKEGTLEIGIEAGWIDKFDNVFTGSLARKGIKYSLSDFRS